jgi:hypothetical protein
VNKIPDQPTNPPEPQPMYGIHKVVVQLNWDKDYPDKSNLFIEEFYLTLEVDFEDKDPDIAVQEEIKEWFYKYFDIQNLETSGICIIEWKIDE